MAGRYQREKRRAMAQVTVISIRQAMDDGKRYDNEIKFLRRYSSMVERDIWELLDDIERARTYDDLQGPMEQVRASLGDF